VTLKIFDILGREVANLASEELPPGNYTRQWNAANKSSGIYFYRIQARSTDGGQAHQTNGGQAHQTNGGQAGSFTESKKLILLK
jgi:hypothetical protein